MWVAYSFQLELEIIQEILQVHFRLKEKWQRKMKKSMQHGFDGDKKGKIMWAKSVFILVWQVDISSEIILKTDIETTWLHKTWLYNNITSGEEI